MFTSFKLSSLQQQLFFVVIQVAELAKGFYVNWTIFIFFVF